VRIAWLEMLNFFNAGMVVAQGTVEDVKKDIPELEVAENKESTAEETEEESEDAERDDDLAEAEQLREAEEHREVGSVSFNVDAKYFMFGAPALMLLLILLIIVAGQGKINSANEYTVDEETSNDIFVSLQCDGAG
jgi:ABC-type multidrug transport system ATPase subunit